MRSTYDFVKEMIQAQTPSMSYAGGDYISWKTSARAMLCKLLGIDKFEKVNPEFEIEFTRKIDGATEIRFTFKSEAGYRVPCHLWLPDGVVNPPLMITLQGHSKGMHISMGRIIYESDERSIKGGDRDFCVRAIKEGFAAVAMEQRNFGECGGLDGAPQCMEPGLTNLLMGRTTIGERVWDAERLLDVIEEHFSDKIDINCMCVMGNSGGGTTTCYLAALEDRLVLAMPSCAMCSYKDSIGARRHCTCNYIPHIAEYFDMGDLMAMAFPKYWVQVNGKDDTDFPLFAAEAVFNAGKQAYIDNGAGNRATHIIGQQGHRFYADDAWPVVHKYLGR